MADVIVFGSLAFAAVFVLIWLMRPEVRTWLEQPKHRFHDAARQYDRAEIDESGIRDPDSCKP